MGLFFVPTSVTAIGYAEPGQVGELGSQINLADSLGFSLMGGFGRATVAIADRDTWELDTALGVNLAGPQCWRLLGSGSVTASHHDRNEPQSVITPSHPYAGN